MREHESRPEEPEQPPRLSDSDLVNLNVELASAAGQEIDDATARVIASLIHGGQASALYSLASTGAIDNVERLTAEWVDLYNQRSLPEEERQQLGRWLDMLGTYCVNREGRGPVAGWSELWVSSGYDEDDRCSACGEHIADPHAVGCPVGDLEDGDV